jgi:hypothetical protein
MLATLPHRIRVAMVAMVAMCVLSISPLASAATCPVSACSAPYCSVENDPIPDPSKDLPGFPAPFRSEKLNGAGPYMNAYAVNGVATRCTNGTPAITRLWWHNIDFARYQSSGAPELPILAPGEAMTWKFTAPASGISAFTYDRGGDGIFTPAFISLSQAPCDFDVTKVTVNACYKSGTTIFLPWHATAGAAESYECKLVPGQTYFVNLRMQDARPASQGGQPTVDACAAIGQTACGGTVQIR